MKNVYLPKVENSFTFALLGSKTEFISAILAIIAGIAIIIFIAKRKKYGDFYNWTVPSGFLSSLRFFPSHS